MEHRIADINLAEEMAYAEQEARNNDASGLAVDVAGLTAAVMYLSEKNPSGTSTINRETATEDATTLESLGFREFGDVIGRGRRELGYPTSDMSFRAVVHDKLLAIEKEQKEARIKKHGYDTEEHYPGTRGQGLMNSSGHLAQVSNKSVREAISQLSELPDSLFEYVGKQLEEITLRDRVTSGGFFATDALSLSWRLTYLTPLIAITNNTDFICDERAIPLIRRIQAKNLHMFKSESTAFEATHGPGGDEILDEEATVKKANSLLVLLCDPEIVSNNRDTINFGLAANIWDFVIKVNKLFPEATEELRREILRLAPSEMSAYARDRMFVNNDIGVELVQGVHDDPSSTPASKEFAAKILKTKTFVDNGGTSAY
jgi:hypothetical protein